MQKNTFSSKVRDFVIESHYSSTEIKWFQFFDKQTVDLEVILETMDKSHALVYIIESVKAAYERNAFTIGETEVISKAIRVLSKEEFTKNN